MPSIKPVLTVTKLTRKTYRLDQSSLEELICQWFVDHVGKNIKPHQIRWVNLWDGSSPDLVVEIEEILND